MRAVSPAAATAASAHVSGRALGAGRPAAGEAEGDDRAELLAVLRPSPERIDPVCPHFGVCGGCAVQHASDATVAAWKAGIGRGAQAGVLIKNAEALEHARSLATVVVDKNGKVAYAKVQEIKVAREDKDILAALAKLS